MNTEFPEEISRRMEDSEWDKKIASGVMRRVDRRNRIYRTTMAFASIFIITGFFLFQNVQIEQEISLIQEDVQEIFDPSGFSALEEMISQGE